MEQMHGVVWFELHLILLCHARKRKWLLMRNPDGSAINGTMNSTSLSLLSGKTSHKKQWVSPAFVFRQWGFAGRTIFTRPWKVVTETAQWQSCRLLADFMLWTVMTDVWVLWLPLFPCLGDDKTPQETEWSRFYGWQVLQTFGVRMLHVSALGVHHKWQ